MPSQNLVQRIVVAAIAIPVVVGIIWLGGWVLAATLAVLGVLGAREIYDFGRRQGIEALERTGWLAAAAIPLLAYWAKAPVFFLGALWLMLALALAMARRGPAGRPLTSVSITLFGWVYASGMLTFLIAIRHGGGGAATLRPAAYVLLTLFPLVITWICDTAAMAVGTALAGPKLAPVLSPKKTQAGAIGGTLGGVATALVIGKFVLNRQGWGGGAGASAPASCCCLVSPSPLSGRSATSPNRSSSGRRASKTRRHSFPATAACSTDSTRCTS